MSTYVPAIDVEHKKPPSNDDIIHPSSMTTAQLVVTPEKKVSFDNTTMKSQKFSLFRLFLVGTLTLIAVLLGTDIFVRVYNKEPSYETPQASSSSRQQNAEEAFIGTWKSTNLLPGLDPGLPDEDVIVIDETNIHFPNGGGGFGNGAYTVYENKIFKKEGRETITYELVDNNNNNNNNNKLKVTFAGGAYGNPDPVIYVRSSSLEAVVDTTIDETTDDELHSYPSSDDHDLLPFDIPIDRAFDVQWNPPGYPVLETSWLRHPIFADSDNMVTEDNHYAFEVSKEDGNVVITGFVQVSKITGERHQIFDTVDFVLVSDDVLMFNGNSYYESIPGGGYGTIIKGRNVPAGDSDRIFDDTQKVEDSDVSPTEWLAKNFP